MIKEESRFVDNLIFEGIVSLRSLMDAYNSSYNDRRIIKVIYDIEKTKGEIKEYSWLCNRARELSFEIQLEERDVIDKMTVGSSHGGIATFATKRQIPSITSNCHLKEDGFYVMLDGIEDPYNFGYALRSLYAAGCDGIILKERNWMSASGVVCRASAGASEYLPMFISSDTVHTVNLFRSNGMKIVCSDLRNSVSLFQSNLKRPLFLIIGGEKRGISRSVLELSDFNVRIDYGRETGTSLSAASAATVVGFEVLRQNL